MLNSWTNVFQLALSFTDIREQSISITVFPVALEINNISFHSTSSFQHSNVSLE